MNKKKNSRKKAYNNIYDTNIYDTSTASFGC